MASTYSDRLRIELIGTGEQSGVWGNTTNTNLGTLLEEAIAGVASITMTDADYTLTVANGATDQSRKAVLVMGGTLSTTRNVICPSKQKVYVIKNGTSGGQSIVLKTSAGTGVTVANGKTVLAFCDGTNVLPAVDSVPTLDILTNLTVNGAAVINEAGGNNDFRVEGDTDVNLLFTDASADAVGVGTNTPGAKLNVVANTAGDAVRITQTGAGNSLVVEDSANPDSTPFVVRPDGNVGIGVSAPTVKLAVSGETSLDGSVTINEAGADANFRVEGISNQNLLVVLASANKVGIGTANPEALLSVSGTATVGAGAAVAPSLSCNGDSDTGIWFPAANTVAVSTGGSERLRIDATVASITTSLSVSGVTSFADGTAAAPSITNTGDLNTGIAFPAADTIILSTAGVERARVHPGGGVSIGSATDPGADALSVVSQITGGYNNSGTNTAAQALGTYRVSKVTISADTTLTTTVPAAGAQATIIIVTSGTTTRTVIFGTGFKSTGTLATGTLSGRTFTVAFVSDGTSLIETSRTVSMA